MTNQDIIEAALNELGFGGLSYRLRPQDIATGMTRLKAMMRQWEGRGLVTGYIIPEDDDVSPETEESGLLPYAEEAVFLALAKAMAPAYGKVLNPETIKNARAAYNLVMRESTTAPGKRIDYTAVPLGAGHKRHDARITMTPDPDPDAAPDISAGAGNFVVVPE